MRSRRTPFPSTSSRPTPSGCMPPGSRRRASCCCTPPIAISISTRCSARRFPSFRSCTGCCSSTATRKAITPRATRPLACSRKTMPCSIHSVRSTSRLTSSAARCGRGRTITPTCSGRSSHGSPEADMVRPAWSLVPLVLGTFACAGSSAPGAALAPAPPPPGSFGADLQFLRAHTPVVVLHGADPQVQIAVAPGFQGRVMTSTADGIDGPSYGYIHRPVIALDARQPHMTVLGGEDRFWVGPEGGQFGLYFPPGAKFDTDAWQVPEPIDWGAWPITSQTDSTIAFAEPMSLRNYSGTAFSLRVDRTIRVLDRAAVTQALGTAPGAATRVVAFESDNAMTNTGPSAWRTGTGLLSVWIIGMLRPTPHTTVVVPF